MHVHLIPIDAISDLDFSKADSNPKPEALDAAADSIRGALRDDGTLLVKEIRCADTLEANRKNPMLAMMFGFSITSCMSSATSEPGGMGLGTVGLPESKLRDLATDAGFTTVVPHDPGEPANVYYEVRP